MEILKQLTLGLLAGLLLSVAYNPPAPDQAVVIEPPAKVAVID